jgi:hypothetical protein
VNNEMEDVEGCHATAPATYYPTICLEGLGEKKKKKKKLGHPILL